MTPAGVLSRARLFADLHFYQKWRIVWRHLATLPQEQSLRVLDAGCGDGRWSIEIALRRPAWTVTGIDRDDEEINQGPMLFAVGEVPVAGSKTRLGQYAGDYAAMSDLRSHCPRRLGLSGIR